MTQRQRISGAWFTNERARRAVEVALGGGSARSVDQIQNFIHSMDAVHFTERDDEELANHQRRWFKRVEWALNEMRREGIVRRIRRGVYMLVPEGERASEREAQEAVTLERSRARRESRAEIRNIVEYNRNERLSETVRRIINSESPRHRVRAIDENENITLERASEILNRANRRQRRTLVEHEPERVEGGNLYRIRQPQSERQFTVRDVLEDRWHVAQYNDMAVYFHQEGNSHPYIQGYQNSQFAYISSNLGDNLIRAYEAEARRINPHVIICRESYFPNADQFEENGNPERVIEWLTDNGFAVTNHRVEPLNASPPTVIAAYGRLERARRHEETGIELAHPEEVEEEEQEEEEEEEEKPVKGKKGKYVKSKGSNWL